MAYTITKAPMGQGIPLCYGYVWCTGYRFIEWEKAPQQWLRKHPTDVGEEVTDDNGYIQRCTTAGTTGDTKPSPWNETPTDTTDDGSVVWTNDNHGKQYGFYLLGEGEWDGFNALHNRGGIAAQGGFARAYGYAGAGTWINNAPDGEYDVHFHPGFDTPVGTGLSPVSNGGDQLVDAFYNTELPPGLQPQTFSGLAYVAIRWQVQEWDPGGKLDLIGLWRTKKCRIFDEMGNQTDYAFTTNPAWQWVDLWLSRAIFPRSEYNIDTGGIQALDDIAKACFDWGAVYEWSQDCDYVLANGRKRFEGSFAFTSPATVQALEEQILLCARSYRQESGEGKLQPMMDKPRASVFTLTGAHVLPNTLSVDQKQVHANGNDYTGNFLDLGIPAVGQIDSISFSDTIDGGAQDEWQITTIEENPIAKYDTIVIGDSDNDDMNVSWLVQSVVDDHTFMAVVPAGQIDHSETASGGVWGYPHTRFTKRSPHIVHWQHAAARGQIG